MCKNIFTPDKTLSVSRIQSAETVCFANSLTWWIYQEQWNHCCKMGFNKDTNNSRNQGNMWNMWVWTKRSSPMVNHVANRFHMCFSICDSFQFELSFSCQCITTGDLFLSWFPEQACGFNNLTAHVPYLSVVYMSTLKVCYIGRTLVSTFQMSESHSSSFCVCVCF